MNLCDRYIFIFLCSIISSIELDLLEGLLLGCSKERDQFATYKYFNESLGCNKSYQEIPGSNPGRVS